MLDEIKSKIDDLEVEEYIIDDLCELVENEVDECDYKLILDSDDIIETIHDLLFNN